MEHNVKIAWRETAASLIVNKGSPPPPPPPRKKIKCRDYAMLEKRRTNLDNGSDFVQVQLVCLRYPIFVNVSFSDSLFDYLAAVA